MKNTRTFLSSSFPIRKCLPFVLVALAFVVSGCPRNQYVVDLKPNGATIERKLTFYREDGVDSKTGNPNYCTFNAAELAAITNLYPTNSLTNEGQRHVVCGEFAGAMPRDVGGAGGYTNWETSLGAAGFYEERFRGNDDLAGMTEQRFKAADRLADLLVGWSRKELGKEPRYGQLHRFLDVDVRRDIKNLAQYFWEGRLVSCYRTNADEEFVVRFGQYLLERGYFGMEDVPLISRMFSEDKAELLMPKIQRLVARKMGVPDTSPIPASLAFLRDETAAEVSLNQYLAGTELYQARLKQWEEQPDRKPDAKPPDPSVVINDALSGLFEFDLFGTPDHLRVRLSLPAAPTHSNGRWDAVLKQVVWESNIEERTNQFCFPFCCYANWTQPNQEFQTRHFGKVVLTGDELTQYCLWRISLEPKKGQAWDAFVASLEPGSDLEHELDVFRFSGESTQPVGTNALPAPSVFACDLIKKNLR